MNWYLCTISSVLVYVAVSAVTCQDVPVSCGGFIKADFPVDFTKIQIKLYTAGGSLRDSTDCAPNIGYFLIPLYDKGEFVLKVEGPEGWKTEPSEVRVIVDGETDVCSRGEDINFKLLGFSILGQVVSDGVSVGPRGVTLELKQEGSTVHTTTSTDEGRFLFEGVPPGTYSLEASHQLWTIPKTDTKVVVTDGSSNVPAGSVVVKGYNVKGQVASDGEPIPGVQFLLYPEKGKKVDCEMGDFPKGVANKPSCVAVSDVSGVYSFSSLPPGRYHIVPYYRQNDIDFKVHPPEAEFEVFNDTVTIQPPFEVHGFSVSGQVLRATKGGGVTGAHVLVDGEEVTLTDAHGGYQLLNVTTGRYNIKIVSPDALLEFNEVQVYLSPSDPVIPTITPAKYGVCGHVTILHPPPAAVNVPRTVQVLVGSPSVVKETVTVDKNSKFCVLLPLGEYRMKVVVSEGESSQGLLVLPSERTVDMRDRPLPESTVVTFEQFTTTLSGSVACLGKCSGNIEVHLRRASTESGQELTTKVSPKAKKATFSFENVLPGKVKVSVAYPKWCWKRESVDHEVTTEGQREVVFEQTGYSMEYTVSHDTTVTYSTVNQTAVEVVLTGNGNICLEKSGVYTIHPKSCHKFKKDIYKFDTSSPQPLVLEAQKHYINVSVLTEEKSALSLSVRSLRFGAKEQSLKPLIVAKQLDSGTHQWKYSFSFLSQPGDEAEISPVSPELMFSPTTRVITVSNDCPEEVSPFLGSVGLMVSGHVHPALVGVAISIITEEDGLVTSTSTDAQGQYRVGPFHSDKKVTVSADKEGYTFEPLPEDPQSFKALKLSKIVIKVVSQDGSPLSNVLVSLSGANFRSNNFTSVEGTITYLRLNPGQYFIKALLREYDFQPSSKVIDLVQGGSEEIVFTASRVAFSCSGKVTTLNRQPLEGVNVKAAGRGDGECGSYGMETPTDQNGDYRLRGLMPGCDFALSVELDSEIDKTLPVSRVIKVSDADIEGVEFVAMIRPTQVYITGNVVTDSRHMSSLKAVLSHDNAVLSTVTVSTAGFFDFPPLPIRDESYMVSLETSLSSNSHTLRWSEEVVHGDRDSHITLTFTAQEVPSTPDSQRGSIVALVITVAIIFALVNVDKLLVVVQNLANGQRDNVSSPVTDYRRKTGRRR